MRVLFTHSYFLRFDPKQYKTAMPYAPLGTLYAAAYLRTNGFNVGLFDTMFAHGPEEACRAIDSFKPDILISYDDGFNYLTKMCLTNMREACFVIQQYAREKGCKVITCSSDATDRFELYLNNGANAVAMGEGEQTVLELCKAFEQGTEIKTIQGIAFQTQEGIVCTPKREVIRNLDSLPAPAFDLLDIGPYKKMWLEKHGYFSFNFVTTRGCPYKCNWCAKPIYGNRYNTHGATAIVKQIQYWQQQFGFSHIWFADDIFGLKPEWIKEFAAEIKASNLRIKYKIQSRADLLQSETYVKHLAESGCAEAWIGAESGSQRILDAMDKGIQIEQIHKAVANLRQHKIRVALFLQLGYLTETGEDIAKTLQMLKELTPDDIGISVSYPLPGTGFYEKVKEELKGKSNWKDSDDLDLLFKNTYQPEFYKELQRYIHYVYRKQKALKQLYSGRTATKALAVYAWAKNALQAYLKKQKLMKLEPHAAASL